MPIKYFASTDTYVELKDTMKLQKVGLDNFANMLGYEWSSGAGAYYRCCPFRGIIEGHPRSFVSLNTMQNWHNGKYLIEHWHRHDSVLERFSESLGVKVDQAMKAKQAKLVQTTHLQYSKKQRKLLCTDHQIQFA